MKRDDSLLRPQPLSNPKRPGRVRRFTQAERRLHWSCAARPFVLMVTGGWLLTVSPKSGIGGLESRVIMYHKFAGICFILLPLLVFANGNRKDILENVRLALSWNRNDLRWFYLPFAKIFWPSVKAPEAGKFNPGQKLNILIVITMGHVFALTGLLIWVSKTLLIARLVHAGLFVAAVPLVLGHIYMAILHPATRPSFWAIITGHVDWDWARHHHPGWVKDLVNPNVAEAENE